MFVILIFLKLCKTSIREAIIHLVLLLRRYCVGSGAGITYKMLATIPSEGPSDFCEMNL